AAAGAPGLSQFGAGGRTVRRCASRALAAIGLARRCGWHLATRGHAGTWTTLAGRTTGCACGATSTRTQGRAGTTLGLRTRIGRTLGTLRAVLLTGTTGNNANVARAGIALAGGHERLTLARFAGFTRRFRLGRRRSGFCSAAGFLGLAAFFFLASSFFADLTTTVFVLDAARLFSGKAFAILGLASASQSQRLTAGFGFSR